MNNKRLPKFTGKYLGVHIMQTIFKVCHDIITNKIIINLLKDVNINNNNNNYNYNKNNNDMFKYFLLNDNQC